MGVFLMLLKLNKPTSNFHMMKNAKLIKIIVALNYFQENLQTSHLSHFDFNLQSTEEI